MHRPVNKLIHQFNERGLTLALAESATCGLATHQLSTVRGTSNVLMGSVICYNESVKSSLLSISPALIKRHTAESREVTDALVKNLKRLFKVNVYAAITGLASPGGSESKDKPVGTIFYAVLYKQQLHSTRMRFLGSPMEVKKKACDHLYKYLLDVTSMKK